MIETSGHALKQKKMIGALRKKMEDRVLGEKKMDGALMLMNWKLKGKVTREKTRIRKKGGLMLLLMRLGQMI